MTAGHYWHLVGKGQEYHTLEMDGTALHNEDVSCVQCQLCPYWETPPGRGVTDFGSSLFLRLSVLVAVVLADYKFNFSMDSVRYPMYLKKQNKTKQILSWPRLILATRKGLSDKGWIYVLDSSDMNDTYTSYAARTEVSFAPSTKAVPLVLPGHSLLKQRGTLLLALWPWQFLSLPGPQEAKSWLMRVLTPKGYDED